MHPTQPILRSSATAMTLTGPCRYATIPPYCYGAALFPAAVFSCVVNKHHNVYVLAFAKPHAGADEQHTPKWLILASDLERLGFEFIC